MIEKKERRERKAEQIRRKISGNKKMPRLSVFRSVKHIYAQIIDDQKGETLVAAREKELKDNKGTKSERAKKIGLLLAQKALKVGIKKVVFDRNGYLYHGRVRALAQGAREGGLNF
ncbi:50S ribosomal protein L18 [Candidatus Curtissbacteria bacterium RBG_16_39_7]|uniref:Large ribosomal subunit protein uL18 n=1 Tax=Candidatus Curtissbacteria bacterium RBG_16_39_7 TaxID=1797707 RepID=A0A1F5G1I7_9BACT|nr:MAG: 50S ribosomal protein L18 [Candidatus Curtissbacteria bacterium RBG_16_39_7]